MSYILEALKKSEQERELGKVPTLKNAPQGGHDANNKATVWLLCAGVFMASLASAYFYFKSQRLPAVSSQVSSSVESVSVVDDEISSQREQSETSLFKQRMDIDDIKQADIAQRDKWLSSRAAPAKGLAQSHHEENISEDLAEESKKQVVVSPQEDSQDVAVVPLLDALPLATRQRIPELSLDVHVYALEPSERFILLNMKRYAEGQQTREGLVVEEVVSDGVIFSFQGTLFRLKN